MRIYEQLEEWKFELAYYDDAKLGKECPTPKGVKRYIGEMFKLILEKDEQIRILEKTVKLLENNNK